jgi:hypothetical protein
MANNCRSFQLKFLNYCKQMDFVLQVTEKLKHNE